MDVVFRPLHENLLDTADTDVIEKYFSTGLVDGVTTNPLSL